MIFIISLHYAAENGHQDDVEYLIIHGSEINTEDFFDTTPLPFSAENGHVKVV